MPPKQSLLLFSSFGVVSSSLAIAQQRKYLIIWSKGCLAALWENIGQPYPLKSSVCTLPGGAPCILWNVISLSLHFTNLDDKPNTQIIVPYSSWCPIIPSTGSPNENIGAGDYVTGSVFSKRAILFILSDSEENNLWLFFSS